MDFIPEGARIFRLEDGLSGPLGWLVEAADAPGAIDLPHAIPSGTGLPVRPADQALIAQAFGIDYARFGYERPPGQPVRGPAELMVRLASPIAAFLERRGRL